MKVSVFGVGYVGCVTAACLAREGNQVIGVDVDRYKVESINAGRAPFFEPGLSSLVREMVAAGRLTATTDHGDAMRNSDIALICVGTPSQSNGAIRLDYLREVLACIGRELRRRDGFFLIVLRSTVLPTAIQEELIPLLEHSSGKRAGEQFGFVYNPEFLREGSALKDFQDAPWTIIGSFDSRDAETVAQLYRGLSSPIVKTDPNTAVLVKYFSNAFHALKVVFANEVSHFCREMGGDSKQVMDIFCQDTKLNVSHRYLMPGFAFGGSCLPKDVKALTAEANKRGLNLMLMDSILASNEMHLRYCIQVVAELGKKKVGLLGLTFKAGTDDLRESPAVELAERLIGKGFEVRIHEPSIGSETLHGTNLAFVEKSIPHIWKLLVADLDELFRYSEVVVITQQLKPDERRRFAALRPEQVCFDFSRTLSPEEVGGEYRNIDSACKAPAVAAVHS